MFLTTLLNISAVLRNCSAPVPKVPISRMSEMVSTNFRISDFRVLDLMACSGPRTLRRSRYFSLPEASCDSHHFSPSWICVSIQSCRFAGSASKFGTCQSCLSGSGIAGDYELLRHSKTTFREQRVVFLGARNTAIDGCEDSAIGIRLFKDCRLFGWRCVFHGRTRLMEIGNYCFLHGNSQTKPPDVVITVLGVEFHALIEPADFLPSIAPDEKQGKIRMVFERQVWRSRLLDLSGIIRRDSGDKRQIVRQEQTVGPRGKLNVVVGDKNMLNGIILGTQQLEG